MTTVVWAALEELDPKDQVSGAAWICCIVQQLNARVQVEVAD
jgi:hypothetical protein